MNSSTWYSGPYVAKHDLSVIKVLRLHDDGQYYTIMQHPVEFDRLLTPIEEEETVSSWFFGGSVFHSYPYFHKCWPLTMKDAYYFHAIIPKGSNYWVNNNLMEVCSKRIIITYDDVLWGDYKFCGKLIWSHVFDLFRPIFNKANENEVGLGWLLADDECFYHPLQLPKNLAVQAIVISNTFYKETKRESCQILRMDRCKRQFVCIQKRRKSFKDWITNTKRYVCVW